MKKPPLYSKGKGENRTPSGFFKGRVTVYNVLYYRGKGHERKRYSGSHINNIYADAPWYVDCTYPRYFVHHNTALEYAHSEATHNTLANDAWRRDRMERGIPYGY